MFGAQVSTLVGRGRSGGYRLHVYPVPPVISKEHGREVTALLGLEGAVACAGTKGADAATACVGATNRASDGGLPQVYT